MPDGNNPSAALQKVRETSLAFDELIVQVGRAISRAQQEMDLSQLNFQREVMRALQQGRLRRLDVNPANAYAIPETTLDLKIGLSMHYAEGSNTPTLSAMPLNAASTNQNDINVETATELQLRFVSVPQSQQPPGPAPSNLTAQAALELAQADRRVAAALARLTSPAPDLTFVEDERLWMLVYREAREPVLFVLIDDRQAALAGIILKRYPAADEDLESLGPPYLERVEPRAGSRGDLLTIYGDNFLTLAGQTVLKLDGQPIPIIRLSMNAIAFKVPAWAVRGDVEVMTPLGTTAETGHAAFTPLPGLEAFEPKRGYYDALRQKGSWFSVYGHNLRNGCAIRFATGIQSRNVQIISAAQMQVEVPEGAGSGPLTLVYGERTQTVPELFIVLPRLESVAPRQARVGDEVTVKGNSLDEISEVSIGGAIIPRRDFTLHTPTLIRFRLPPNASDGPVHVRQSLASGEIIEVLSKDLFYVVPRITGFGSSVVVAGQLLTIYGEGLDPDPEMMALLFDAPGGWSEGRVLAVSADQHSLTAQVPYDAVSGFVLLLRKRVYSDISAEETSTTSSNKLAVLAAGGDPSDLILEERFSTDLSRWTMEAGAWQIDQGLLASTGLSRLGTTLPEPHSQLTVYTDVLQAERFGVSLTPAGGGLVLQIWLNLLGTAPALTWSTLDTQNNQKLLAGIPLALPAGENHLVQLSLVGGKLTLALDQEIVHSYDWGDAAIQVQHIGLLGDSAIQRWDNVLILKGDYLNLPPAGEYRFNSIPKPPPPPGLRIDNFTPAQGSEGTEVVLTGIGLDEAARVFFGGVEAHVTEALGDKITVKVPVGAKTGPLEVDGRGGMIVTSGERWFVLPPKITALTPARVQAGQRLNILGANLPATLEGVEVQILNQPAALVSASASLLTVLVPDVAGTGILTLSYSGFTSQAPAPIEVYREQVVFDMIPSAPDANWTTGAGAVNFGLLANSLEDASVQLRSSERLEDDGVYGPVLFVHPPAPSRRALRGLYPVMDAPEGRLELRLEFGMLWSAAPAAEEVADVDGVAFEASFILAKSGEAIPLLPRTTCVHDGSLERFNIDTGSIAGQRGQLCLSVFAGRTGLRDETGLINAKLVQLI